MLEGNQIASTCQAESNHCLFEVNTKEPRLNLGPVSIVSSFELKSDLDMCLDLNLNCAMNSNEFQMDFSLPTKRLNCFVAPANKLNVLPENIDFSEMLSFPNPLKQSVGDFYNTLAADLDTNGSYFEQQIPDKIEENLLSDQVVEEPKSECNFALPSEFFMNMRTVNSFICVAKTKRIKQRSQQFFNNRHLIEQNFIDTSSESLRSLCKDYMAYMKILSVYTKYKEPMETCERLKESSLLVDNNMENTPAEAVKIVPKVTENVTDKDSSLILKDKEEPKVIEQQKAKESHETELAVKQEVKLDGDKENSTKNIGRSIVDVRVIQKSGVQIFRKPTKLFVFDCLKEWKKRGEGQIGIWQLDQSDSRLYYVLLWDKSTEQLLIHMRLDRKWGINYLANSTNSCRWSHFNYANCPEGVRERLACRFRDSDVAAQFVGIVAKCVANTRLHFN